MSLDNHLSFPEVLSRVPDLLTSCLACWGECVDGIKVLRMVCKEAGCAAVTAATRCSLQVGENACLQPQQVVRLMRASHFKSLLVTLISASGTSYSSLEEQLATCSSQLCELLHGIGPALQGVSTFTLRCRHKESASQASMLNSKHQMSTCQSVSEIIAAAVCKLLGAVMPLLCNLHAEGCCGEAAFKELGSSCPHLTHLHVNASSVPITALTSLGHHLPSLLCLTVTASPVQHSSHELGDYVGACLHALKDSTSLTQVVLDFDAQLQPQCMQGKWEQVPKCVSKLVCACEVGQLGNAEALLSGLDTLSLSTSTGFVGLFEILTRAPRLQKLSVTGPVKLLLHCADDAPPFDDIPLLIDCLLAGMQLDVPLIRLWGSSMRVSGVLAAMPTLASVRSCTLRYSNITGYVSMAHVARTFPNLAELHLVGPLNGQIQPGVELLGPLADCSALKHLRMCIPTTLTTSELVGLCLSMPSLIRLAYNLCDGVDLHQLVDTLAVQRQDFVVESNTFQDSDDFDG